MEPINDRTVVGGTYPADIWREFMISALEDVPISDFEKPDKELVDIKVCTVSNLLTTFWCPEETNGWRIFIEGEEPEDICNVHNKVEVPNAVGLNIGEARALFENLYFVINEIYDFDEVYNQDIIFKQNPEAGTIAESLDGEKLSITLYVSKGKMTFTMPDLTGMDLTAAKQVIENLELIVDDIIYEFSDGQPLDKVFNQSPVPDSMVSKSTGVILYVSKGENPQATIPYVLEMTEEEALTALEGAGFINVTVIPEESEEEKDKVFSQTPVSGIIYDKLLEIIIKVSQGIKVPDVTGMTKEDAIIELEDLGFIVEILPDATSVGNVVNQIPAAEQYLDFGSTVTIEIE
jgi:serine/threonine-protein kinase